MSKSCILLLLLALPLVPDAAVRAETPEKADAVGKAAAPADPPMPFLGGFLTETRILYPLRLDHWEAQGEHRFEMAELGASVRYRDVRRDGRWLDAYFYPAGVLPPEQLRSGVEQAMEEIAGIVGRPDGYERVEMGELRAFVIPVGKGDDEQRYEAFSVSMRLERQGAAYHSAMVMLVKDLYYIKTRMSVAADAMKQERVRSLLEDRTTELVRASALISSGACWDPQPILARTTLDAKAPGALVSTSVEGVPVAVAFADRVEALDPESPAARVMQFLGASMSGRWVRGCNPPEDLLPTVPEGMRELRFEYPAPSNETDGNTPGLRSRRIGVG